MANCLWWIFTLAFWTSKSLLINNKIKLTFIKHLICSRSRWEVLNTWDLVYSLPDPGDWVLPHLKEEEFEVPGGGSQVTRGHMAGEWQSWALRGGDDVAITVVCAPGTVLGAVCEVCH